MEFNEEGYVLFGLFNLLCFGFLDARVDTRVVFFVLDMWL